MGIGKSVLIIFSIIIMVGTGIQLSRIGYFEDLYQKNFDLSQFYAEGDVSEELVKSASDDRYVILYDKTENESIGVTSNIELILKNIKKDYSKVEVSREGELNPDGKKIIITTSNLSKIAGLGKIMDNVHSGGSVLIAISPDYDRTFKSISGMLGVAESGKKGKYGFIKLEDSTFPGMGGEVFTNMGDLSHYAIPCSLEASSKIYMKAEKGVPLLWTSVYGSGTVVVFNSQMLQRRDSPGAALRCISLMNDTFIYPAINAKIFFIDGYPSELPSGDSKAIRKEYGKSIKRFYMENWWSDMLGIAKRNNSKYTAVFVEKYSKEAAPPFLTGDAASVANFSFMSEEILKSGGEVGVSGYSLKPLVLDGKVSNGKKSQGWTSIGNMESSLRNAAAYFYNHFPNYRLQAYVPPSNLLSGTGKKALKNALPSVRIISAIYDGGAGNSRYEQDLGVTDDGYINIPRLTSGLVVDDNARWMMANGVVAYGLVSHYIDPYDVIDNKRNYGLDWKELSESYDYILWSINRKYPWLESCTVSEAAGNLAEYMNLDYTCEYLEDGITVRTNRQSGFPYTMSIFSEKEISYGRNCEVQKKDEGFYLVTVRGKDFSLKYGG